MRLPATARDLVRAAIAARDPWSAAGAHAVARGDDKLELERIMFGERKNVLALARWEHTPSSVLLALSGSDDDSVQRRLDRNPGTPALALCSLYGGGKRGTLVSLIAQHQHTPPAILESIAEHDADADCVKAVSRNPAAPVQALRSICRRHAGRYDSELAGNPVTPGDVLLQLYARGDGYVRAAVIAHEQCPAVLLREAANEQDLHVLRQLARKAGSGSNGLLARLAAHEDVGVRRGVAGNPAATAASVLALARDPSEQVRRSVAARSDLRPATMQVLARDEDHWVRQWLARNPACPSRLLTRLARDEESEVRRAVARNVNCPARLLRQLANDPQAWVRSAVAYQPNASVHLLKRLALDNEVDVLSGVASNARTPQKILQQLMQSQETDVRRGVILNSSAKRATLLPLLQDPYYLHRLLLVGNDRLREKDKWGLHDDPDHSVRFAVFKWFAAWLGKQAQSNQVAVFGG